MHDRGNGFYQEGKFEEAIDCYDQAVEIDPGLLESYFNRSLPKIRLERYIKALEDLNK